MEITNQTIEALQQRLAELTAANAQLEEKLAREIENRNKQHAVPACFENSKSLFLITTNRNAEFISANQFFCETFGLSQTDIVGSSCSALIIQKDRAAREKIIQQCALRPNTPHTVILQKQLSDSSIITTQWEITGVPEPDGEVNTFICIGNPITEKIANQEALQEVTNQFKTLIAAIPDAIFFKDGNGRWLIANEPAQKLFQLENVDWVGKTDAELAIIHQELRTEHESCIESDELAWKSNGISLYKEFTTDDSGTMHEFEVRKVPVFDDDGNRKALVIIGSDVTERKTIEDKLYRSEEHYRLLVESAQDMIVIYDLDGNVSLLNQAGAEMLGIEGEDYQKHNMYEFVPPEFLDLVKKNVAERMQGYTGTRIWEMEVVSTTGQRIWLEGRSTLITTNGKIEILTIARDIRDRKLEQRKMQQLSSAVEQSPVAIIITDVNGNIEYVNPRVIESTGFTAEELIGKNPRIISSGEQPKELYTIMWETILSGSPWRGEFHNKRKNGELFWELATITPIKDQSGKFSNFLAIKEDITSRKELEQGLLLAKNNAESASRLKDAFISNMSHEIRTPLNGILGMTSVIMETFSRYVSSSEEIFFTSIEKSSKRLIKTVDMIINFSRLEVNDFKISPMLMSIMPVIVSVMNEYKPIAAARSLQIYLAADAEDDRVIFDEFSLFTAITNLIDNAVKFTPSGMVSINIFRDSSDTLCLSVIDTGIGMSEDYLPKIFEPYVQEYSGYGRPYEGLGLGLPLVKKLLDLNGAEIVAKSKKGTGSKFTIRFARPGFHHLQSTLQMGADDYLPSARAQKLQFKPGISVLIVEDDAINQTYMRQILEGTFMIEVAPDADIAFNLFIHRHFDIVLMDIALLKGIDGLQLTQLIRSGNKNNNVPILAVTGHAFPDDEKKALLAGCNAFLAKPFKAEQLLQHMQDLLPKS